MVMMTKEGSTKIINFMSSGVWVLRCGHISYIVKTHYFFKNLLLNSQAQIKQSECIGLPVVIMSKEESTKIVNSITPRAGICLRIFYSRRHRSDKLRV